jgi:hypothetical protein
MLLKLIVFRLKDIQTASIYMPDRFVIFGPFVFMIHVVPNDLGSTCVKFASQRKQGP